MSDTPLTAGLAADFAAADAAARTDTPLAPAAGAPESLSDDDAALIPCAPGYIHVLRIRTALRLIIPVVAVVLFDRLVLAPRGLSGGLLSIGAPFLFILILAVAPQRRFQRIGHALLPDRLRAVDGYLFHRDTIVPFARVQHIDVTRGPVERAFGVATLVVHTAGTHNSVVIVPGLAADEATAMRETIRRHIRADPA